MSALLPQIKGHRAMQEALVEAGLAESDPLVAKILAAMAAAHRIAADALEAGMLEELKKVAGTKERGK